MKKKVKSAVIAFLMDLQDRIEDCEVCHATGEDPCYPKDACRWCGGQGRVVTGWIDPYEVKKLLADLSPHSFLKEAELHDDGTVTYWSPYHRRWCRARRVPNEELAAMTMTERRRVKEHLAKNRD